MALFVTEVSSGKAHIHIHITTVVTSVIFSQTGFSLFTVLVHRVISPIHHLQREKKHWIICSLKCVLFNSVQTFIHQKSYDVHMWGFSVFSNALPIDFRIAVSTVWQQRKIQKLASLWFPRQKACGIF